ncbi:MAG: RNA degradosome polyphosphate kinase, partial [Rhodospirillales bacterium]|nr:RNA degradosome polyphosphate kinase [Rhodospirillales bacterium]
AFNRRVMEEAFNLSHPLLERVRFLSISASNLNEFYMVRVAGLRGQVLAGIKTNSDDGRTPQQQLDAVRANAAELMAEQGRCWRALRAELTAAGIEVFDDGEKLSDEERGWLENHFIEHIFPVLTPIATNPSHPFPFIPNFGFCLVYMLDHDGPEEPLRALLPIPSLLSRFVRLPGEKLRFIQIESVIDLFLSRLFPNYKIRQSGCFRVLRDSEMEIDEEAEDLVRTFESALKRRRRGSVVRLTYNAEMPDELASLVMDELAVEADDAIALHDFIGLADTKELVVDERPELLFPPFQARFPERIRDLGGDIFAAISKKDFIVHHPYESFDAVVQFVRQAAHDPNVVAIKQTLYRTSNDSPIVAALIEAAEAGKSVTAMVELQARFDEEANLRWARNLERAGAQVVYGFLDKKTHAKVNLIVRREPGGLRSYVHYGTGNYHPITAKTYTDLSLFTADPALCRDAARIFNYMTGHAKPDSMEKLAFSPLTLRDTLIDHVKAETRNARDGKPAAIWAKLNALVDASIIDALYEASEAGVEIDLVVRGICCLRPGIENLSSNIRVKSIVGRFLEHARIVCFANGEPLPSANAKIFISSADWMPRNFYRRIETLIPIENPTVHEQVMNEVMALNLKDDKQSWILSGDGRYQRVSATDSFSGHEYFMTHASHSGQSAGKAARSGAHSRHMPD